MKKSICLILSALLLLCSACVFASCGDTVTEAATLDLSAAEAVGADVSTANGELTKQELIDRIYENTETQIQQYIGFSSPDYRTTEEYLDMYATLRDAGVTGMIATYQMFGIDNLGPYLEACCLTGMDAYIQLHRCSGGPDGVGAVDRLEMFRELWGCIKGIYMQDEPLPDLYPVLGETLQDILWALPEAKEYGWVIGANLYPYMSHEERLGTSWEKYYKNNLQYYAETVNPDFYCYDRYPWDGGYNFEADTPWDFVANNLVFYQVARENGGEAWCFLQTGTVGGNLYPTPAQYALEVNAALACGMDNLLLFTVYPVDSKYSGVVDEEGNPTAIYASVKTMAEQTAAMKGIYKNFTFENVIVNNETRYASELSEVDAGMGTSYLTDSYGLLAAVDSDGAVLVGCSRDENGQSGLYVVNLDYLSGEDSTYTLYFTEETSYQIWGEGGHEDLGTAEKLDVTLGCGMGKFVIVNSHNSVD